MILQITRAHSAPGRGYDDQATLWHSLLIDKDNILCAPMQKKQCRKGKFLRTSIR